MLLRSRLSALLAVVALGLVSFASLPWPVLDAFLHGREFSLPGRVIVGCIVTGLVCTGSWALVCEHSQDKGNGDPSLSAPWILPTVTTVATLLFLAEPWEALWQLTVCAVSVAALALLIAGEYYTADSAAHWRDLVGETLQLAAYGLSVPLLVGLRMSFAPTAPVVSAISLAMAVIAFKLLSRDVTVRWRLALAATTVGALLGVMAWLIAGAVASPVTNSLMLVIALYVLVGLVRQLVLGMLRSRVTAEYLLVGLLGLIILRIYAR